MPFVLKTLIPEMGTCRGKDDPIGTVDAADAAVDVAAVVVVVDVVIVDVVYTK
jgi:hypothetical protein